MPFVLKISLRHWKDISLHGLSPVVQIGLHQQVLLQRIILGMIFQAPQHL